jgi:hypothetical protein
MIHHGGSWGGYRAEVIRFPDRALSVSTLCNSDNVDASALAIQVADVWLAGSTASAEQAEVDPKPDIVVPKKEYATQPSKARLLPLVGAYRNPKTGSLRFVELRERTLWLEAFGGRHELRAISDGKFELIEAPFEAYYSFRKDNAVGGMVLQQLVNGKEAAFNALKLHVPTSVELRAYEGNFHCEELGITYRLNAVDGALQRVNARGEPERFRALERGEFNYGNLTMNYRGSAQNGYDAIVLDIGRVRGLVCPRE